MECNINQAINLLEDYIVYTKQNNAIMFFAKYENSVAIINDNFTTVLSLTDFKTQFSNNKFTVYKKISELSTDEIFDEHQVYRQ